ncbi:MAG: lipoprotein [Rhodocyclaceae bacterium]|nr:lipoprotein [Rhodocyclaceae bacterium]
MRYILLSVAALFLAACGTKGPLTMPPPRAVLPAAQPAPAKTDDSKAGTPAAAVAPSSSSTSQK